MPISDDVEAITIDAEVIEPVPLARDPDDADRASYPYLRLAATGRFQSRAFRAVVLENEFVRAAWLPELGGRLVRLEHKPSGTVALAPPDRIATTPGGTRGRTLAAGLSCYATDPAWPGELGPVQHQVVETRDEAGVESRTVVFRGFAAGANVDFHAAWSLGEDSVALRLAIRVANRGLEFAPAESGLALTWSGEPPAPGVFHASGVALAIVDVGFSIDSYDAGGGRALARRRAGELLAPRDVDAWSVAIVPLPADRRPALIAPDLVLTLDGEVRIDALRPLPGHTVFVLDAEGRTVEARVDISPERAFRAAFAELGGPPHGLVVRAPNGREVARWPTADFVAADPTPPAPASPIHVDYRAAVRRPDLPESERALVRATREPALRAGAHVALALRASRAGDAALAMEHLQDALGANAGDALAWWATAALKAHTQVEHDDADLLNAHYLAPLEPTLRAGVTGSNPVVGALADDPESLVDVACHLLEAGLWRPAAEWLEAATTAHDGPMLRLLAAWCHAAALGFHADAAAHIRRADALPLAPPFPWRRIEREALGDLAGRFPASTATRDLSAILASYRGTV